jgi:archaeosortase A (PGF-CTERM-specific)
LLSFLSFHNSLKEVSYVHGAGSMVKNDFSKKWQVSLFLLVPTLLVIIGIVMFPYPLAENVYLLLNIPLFSGLLLLLFGYMAKVSEKGRILSSIGWMLFAFYWSTQMNTLYFGEDGDIFNAGLCIIGVYALFYFAYHEWLSLQRNNETLDSLRWAAGAASVAGLIYFGIEKTPLSPWLIETVAGQSAALLNLFTGNVDLLQGTQIFYEGNYAVTIIFACTAVQSMVLFVGLILPLPKVEAKRKVIALVITILPVYFLNLIRNAGIAFLLGAHITDFNMAHNVIGKGGSLIALLVLLFLVAKIIPEVFDEIFHLIDLPKRKGPLERYVQRIISGGKQ